MNILFDEHQSKIISDLDGFLLPVIHVNDLILTKINTGRLKDQADIQELQHINKLAD